MNRPNTDVLAPPPSAELTSSPNSVIVDTKGTILVTSATDIWDSVGLDIRIGEMLPVVLQSLVQTSGDLMRRDTSPHPCIRAFLWPGIAVSLYAVAGIGGAVSGLTAQRFRARTNLRHAQAAFGLSRRELEILSHVIDGSGTSAIAAELGIADSTVIAHVKSLLLKTKAANRAALAARVLGWEKDLRR